VRRERLKGKDAVKYRLYDEIRAAMKECVTWDKLRRWLDTKGIALDLVKDKDGNIRGVTFTDTRQNVTFAGSKIDRSLSFAQIDRAMAYVVNDTTNRYRQPIPQESEQKVWRDANDFFDFSKTSGGTRQVADDGNIEQQTTGTEGGRTSSGSSIGEAVVEVLLQPNVVPTTGGGGGGASGGWRDDDDDEKNKNKYKPRKRGR